VDSSTLTGGEGPNLNQPYTNWPKRASDAAQRLQGTLANAPIAAKGARGRIGDIINIVGSAFGFDPYGNYIKYPSQVDDKGVRHPSMGQYQANVARDQDALDVANQQATLQSNRENQRLQRQEAQQRIAQSNLNNQRTAYDRQMNDITSPRNKGFEVQDIPPETTTYQTGGTQSALDAAAGAPISDLPVSRLLLTPGLKGYRKDIPPRVTRYQDQGTQPAADVAAGAPITNLPISHLLFSPGLTAQQQGSRLGTVETLTDPDTKQTHRMLRPNERTRQEMTWPTVTPEMAKAFDLPEGAVIPQSSFDAYQNRLKAREARASKPGPAPSRVSPGQQLVDREGNVVYTAPPKPAAAEQKPATRAQFAVLEQRKATALAKAEVDARKRLRGSATVEPEDADTVYGDLAAQKQQIQNAYESEISALTGSDVGHFEYPLTAPPPTAAAPATRAPSQPGARPGPGMTVSEAELRRQAAASGKDPDAAVSIARSRGYRLAP
jgi:hypothetical protein